MRLAPGDAIPSGATAAPNTGATPLATTPPSGQPEGVSARFRAEARVFSEKSPVPLRR